MSIQLFAAFRKTSGSSYQSNRLLRRQRQWLAGLLMAPAMLSGAALPNASASDPCCPPVYRSQPYCPPTIIDAEPQASETLGEQLRMSPPVASESRPVDEAANETKYQPMAESTTSPQPFPSPLVDLNESSPTTAFDSDGSGFNDNDFDLGSGLATNFGSGGATSLAFSDSFNVAPGYIDSAVIQNRVRVRYDKQHNATAGQRERAGYMYPTPAAAGFGTTRGSDYFGVPDELDTDRLSVYFEAALRERFSIFFDVPFLFYNDIPDTALISNRHDNNSIRGVSDISAGFRWGLIACPEEHLTMQVRTTVPTGDSRSLLGTGNTSFDIGLIYDRMLGERTRLFTELNDWQTLDAEQLTSLPGAFDADRANMDANILRYGVGLGYDILRCGNRCHQRSVTGLFEVVGWTVLDGNTPIAFQDSISADGDTIVNGKYGARFNFDSNSIYVGYGHRWTNDFWYTDLVRVEWQRTF